MFVNDRRDLDRAAVSRGVELEVDDGPRPCSGRRRPRGSVPWTCRGACVAASACPASLPGATGAGSSCGSRVRPRRGRRGRRCASSSLPWCCRGFLPKSWAARLSLDPDQPRGSGHLLRAAADPGSPGLSRTATRDRRQPHARAWRFDRMRAAPAAPQRPLLTKNPEHSIVALAIRSGRWRRRQKRRRARQVGLREQLADASRLMAQGRRYT